MSKTGFKETLARDIECYTCGDQPSPFLMISCPVIEEWTTEVRPLGKSFKLVVKGYVKRHPGYNEGDDIVTAAVMWFDRKQRWIRTPAQVFALGEPAGDEIPSA